MRQKFPVVHSSAELQRCLAQLGSGAIAALFLAHRAPERREWACSIPVRSMNFDSNLAFIPVQAAPEDVASLYGDVLGERRVHLLNHTTPHKNRLPYGSWLV